KLRMEQMDHYNKNMPAGSSGIGLMQSSTELIDAEADDDSEDDLYLNDPNTDEPQMPNGGVAPSNVAANQRPYRERATDLSGAMGLYKASLALHQEHHGELPDWVNAALADEIPDYDWSARNGPNDSSKPKEPSLMPKPTADVAGKTLEIAMRGTPGANPSDDEESSSRSSGIFEPYSDASEPAAPGPNPTGDNDANKAGQTSTIGGQPVDLNEDKDDD
ncbi:MAG: hypothetical protein MI806_19425, partial [Minwuiales bacterium]|nr:hypothetical protein [Minwuiales bacterium]